jgi:hypothetical protein
LRSENQQSARTLRKEFSSIRVHVHYSTSTHPRVRMDSYPASRIQLTI